MNKLLKYKFLAIVFILGLFLRLVYINKVPPAVSEAYTGRILSVIAGTVSIILVYIIAYKITKQRSAAQYSSLVYALLPVNIIESRVISWVGIISVSFLIFSLLISEKSTLKKIIGSVLLIISVYYFRSEIWLFSKSFQFNTVKVVNNFFDAISFNKIFFANDSFWIGGIRRFGMVYPEMVPAYLIGIYQLIRYKKTGILFAGLLVIVFASLNPGYPEARELGFIAPLISIVIGNGFWSIINFVKPKISARYSVYKLLVFLYFLFLGYGIVNFFHYYFTHYNLQIKQENLYKTGTF